MVYTRLIVIISLLCLWPSLKAQEMIAVEVPEDDIHRGTVLAVGETPVPIRDESKKAGDVFDYRSPEGPVLRVQVTPSPPVNGRNLRLPVEIVDVVLAKGTTLHLTMPDGSPRTVRIPRKRVLIPQKFFMIVRGAGEAGQHGGKPGDLILEIYPRLTTRLRLAMTSTSDEGVVAQVTYGDQVYTRIKDFNKRLGRRDIDLRLYGSTDPGNRVGLDIQNLNEKYSRRILGLLYSRQTRPDSRLVGRADYIREDRKAKLGGNYLFSSRAQEFEIGNVDRRVEEDFHAQTRLFTNTTGLTFRLEGIDVRDRSFRKLPAAVIRTAGGQFAYASPDGAFDAAVGNLKVEENELMGKIDGRLNFAVNISRPFGSTVSFQLPRGIGTITT